MGEMPHRHERSSNAGSGDPKKLAEAAKHSFGGPGDKVEVHASEEELGVTTPLPDEE